MSIDNFNNALLVNDNMMAIKEIIEQIDDIDTFIDEYYGNYDPIIFTIIRTNNVELLKILCDDSDNTYMRSLLLRFIANNDFASILPELCNNQNIQMLNIILNCSACRNFEFTINYLGEERYVNYYDIAFNIAKQHNNDVMMNILRQTIKYHKQESIEVY